MDLKGKVFVVTGASGGLGKIICDIITLKNGIVVGIYNNTSIKNEKVDAYKCDLKNEDEIIHLADYIKNKYKKIDYLVNCAALSKDNLMDDKTASEFLEVLSVNLVGPFLMCKYLNKFMGKSSVILNISSLDGINTYSFYSMDYSASKAGLINLTQNMASYFADIKCLVIALAWIGTEAVLEMSPKFLKNEMEKHGQKNLLDPLKVSKKIVDILINNDKYKSGDLIKIGDNNE